MIKKLGGSYQVYDHEAEVPQSKDEKRLWAFKYNWYPEVQPYGDTPLLGLNSADPINMGKNIRIAKYAGIDVFICSWWGPGHYTDDRFRAMLDVAQSEGFTICPYLELWDGESPRSQDTIGQWIDYVFRKYITHKAFAQINGEPALWFFASGGYTNEQWQEMTSRFSGGTFIADSADVNCLNIFNGMHDYGVVGYTNPEKRFKAQQLAVNLFAADYRCPYFFSPITIPGFERNDKKGGILPRNDGDTYEKFWNAAIGADPHDIVIVTWDEFAENSHIAPSKNYGMKYVNMTRRFSQQWKGKNDSTNH